MIIDGKGNCAKHGEFVLREGCQQCLAEGDIPFIETDEPIVISRALPTSTALIRVKPEQDALIKALHDQAVGLRDYAEKAVVATEGDYKSRANDLIVIAKLKKALEEKKKEYLTPLREYMDALREAFSTFFDPVIAAERITKEKMVAFDALQRQIRQKQEEVNRLRTEAAEKEMALKGELSESVNLVEVTPEPAKTVKTHLGTAGMTNSWKYEVVDFALLPDEFKVVDGPMLTTFARKHHDQKAIPGVRFRNEPFVTARMR